MWWMLYILLLISCLCLNVLEMEENRGKKKKKISPGLPMVNHRQTWGNWPSAPEVYQWPWPSAKKFVKWFLKNKIKKMPTALAIGKQDYLPKATWRQPSANPPSAWRRAGWRGGFADGGRGHRQPFCRWLLLLPSANKCFSMRILPMGGCRWPRRFAIGNLFSDG